jgi:hypothetical protein
MQFGVWFVQTIVKYLLEVVRTAELVARRFFQSRTSFSWSMSPTASSQRSLSHGLLFLSKRHQVGWPVREHQRKDVSRFQVFLTQLPANVISLTKKVPRSMAGRVLVSIGHSPHAMWFRTRLIPALAYGVS